jgi:hypothetical protein
VVVTRDVNTLKQKYLELEREIRSTGVRVDKKNLLYDSINITGKKESKEFINGRETF